MLDIDIVGGTDTVSVLIKLVGEVCNLDCAYCYERRKPYAGNRLVEPHEVRALLDTLSDRPVRVELHGGEPLLYPKTKMAEVVALLATAPQVVGVSMQTNGTRLDRDWLRIFRPIQHKMEIGISIDGPGQSNSWRFDHAGRPAFKQIVDGITMLADENLNTGLIAVVTNKSIGQERAILEFVAGFPNVSVLKFVPCFDFGVTQGVGPKRSAKTTKAAASGPALGAAWSISPPAYLDFLTTAFDIWTRDGHSVAFVLEPFLALTRALLALPTDNCTYSSVKCAHVVTLYPGGQVGSCDELDRKDAAIGGLADYVSPNAGFAGCKTSEDARALLQKCGECAYWDRCQGGCIATRKRFRKVDREDDYCAYRMGLIDFMSGKMPEAAQ